MRRLNFHFFWQLEITPAGFSIYKQSRADSDQSANYEELQSNMAAAMGGFRYLVIFTVTYAHIFTFIETHCLCAYRACRFRSNWLKFASGRWKQTDRSYNYKPSSLVKIQTFWKIFYKRPDSSSHRKFPPNHKCVESLCHFVLRTTTVCPILTKNPSKSF